MDGFESYLIFQSPSGSHYLTVITLLAQLDPANIHGHGLSVILQHHSLSVILDVLIYLAERN
jgi:hypothetical protein